ncbi:MAG: hypothetical protein NDI69_17590 [Bacteriovoracaceae bacterium]|nr:hypothetical protein [Bacteriovoracaceae bacterium]
MNKYLLIFTLLTFSLVASARQHQMIDTLGISPKGQYVALEEYGYKSQQQTYYVTIKVMNVWKKEYVGKAIEVEVPAYQPALLKKAREKAKILAQEELKRFNIKS